MGFAGGDGGVLGPIENGLVIGILWGSSALVAGALYGLWAGRGVSARRLKGLGAFVPPDTSMAVAWARRLARARKRSSAGLRTARSD